MAGERINSVNVPLPIVEPTKNPVVNQPAVVVPTAVGRVHAPRVAAPSVGTETVTPVAPVPGPDNRVAMPSSAEIAAAAANEYKPVDSKMSAFAQGFANAQALRGKTQREVDAENRKLEKAEKEKARQVAYLKTMDPEMAAAVEAGVLDAQTAYTTSKSAKAGKYSLQKMENGDLIRIDEKTGNYEVLGNFAKPDEEFRQLDADEVSRMGLDPSKSYQVGPDNKIYPIGDAGTNITVNTGTENAADAELRKKLSGKEGESWAAYKDAGVNSAGAAQDMEMLDALITAAPQGPLTGQLAQAFPGISDAGVAFDSVVKRVAPTMRVPGSGSTSDIEYNGMLRSLPSLVNRPEANSAISAMMKAKQAINVERAQIIDQYQNEEISAADARNRIAALNSRSIMTPQIKAAFSGIGVNLDAQPAEDSKPKKITEEDFKALPSGAEFIAPDGTLRRKP